jgi:hypothetical protein
MATIFCFLFWGLKQQKYALKATFLFGADKGQSLKNAYWKN